MPTHNLLLLAGGGIGPEVMAEVKKLIAWMNAHGLGLFESEDGLVGGHGVGSSRAAAGSIARATRVWGSSGLTKPSRCGAAWRERGRAGGHGAVMRTITSRR